MFKRLASSMIFQEFYNFSNYVKGNSKWIFLFLFFSFLAYGIPLTQLTLSIDEEKAMFSSSISTDWISQGRFGIIVIKWFFDYWHVNSITTAFLGVFCLALSGLIWSYQWYNALLNSADKKKYAIPSMFATLLFFTFPAYAENMGFSIMSFELGVGWILTALTVILVFKGFLKSVQVSHIILGTILLTFSISIYQSFLPVFVLGMIASYLIYSISSAKNGISLKFKEFFLYMIKFSMVAIASFILYKVIDKILSFYIAPSGYISNFFAWDLNNVYGLTRNLLGNFKDIILGNVIYGSLMIPCAMICILCVCVTYIFKSTLNKENRERYLVIILLIILLMLAPFLMPILLGAPVPIRVNLNFSLFVGLAWFLLYILIEQKIFKLILILMLLWGSFYQSLSVSHLFYSDYNRYEEDKSLAGQINNRILALNSDENSLYPVVYIGQHAQNIAPNLTKQEVIGYSFFEWDGGNPVRIRNFMNSLGYEFPQPTSEQIEQGKKLSLDMPVWPDTDSVAIKNEMIIVKLSEDLSNYELDLDNVPQRKIEGSVLSKIEFTNMSYNYGMKEFLETSEGIKMVATNADPQASFSINPIAEKDSFNYIRLVVESDTEGSLQLFLAEEDGAYGKFSGTIALTEGENVIYCDKQKLMQNVQSIRIDPPDNSTIILKSIEFYK